MLIEIDHGTVANTNAIQTIEHVPGKSSVGTGRSRVTFTDGRTLVVDRSVESFGRVQGTIIPAQPGYRVMVASPDGDDIHFWTSSVVAFLYAGHPATGPLDPITDEGPMSEHTDWALVRPDGSTTDWDRDHPSVEAYQAHKRAEAKRLREPA